MFPIVCYEGEWKDSKPDGTGCMRLVDGSSYDGNWFAGQRHRRGVSKYASDGKSDKYGYTWKAGDVYDGYWEEGVRHGECEYTWFNGEKLTCRWVDGKSTEWAAKNTEILGRPAIDVQIWDLAGQDVYTLSHAVHFSHRLSLIHI